MDKLSLLLQEARPLYKRNKKNKAVVAALLALSLPVFFFAFLMCICSMGNEIYVSMNNNVFAEQLLCDDYGLSGVK